MVEINEGKGYKLVKSYNRMIIIKKLSSDKKHSVHKKKNYEKCAREERSNNHD